MAYFSLWLVFGKGRGGKAVKGDVREINVRGLSPKLMAPASASEA